MHQYKVTCLKCKQSDILTIDENRHVVMLTKRLMDTPLLSFRWRGDLKWGFLCKCENDSRLAREEADDYRSLVGGSPDGIKAVVDSLKIKDELKFSMDVI